MIENNLFGRPGRSTFFGRKKKELRGDDIHNKLVVSEAQERKIAHFWMTCCVINEWEEDQADGRAGGSSEHYRERLCLEVVFLRKGVDRK